MDITTLIRVQTLGNCVGSADAAAIEQLIDSVSAEVEKFLGRPLLVAARTEDYDVREHAKRIFLRARPVTSVASVSHDLDRAFGSDTLLTVNTDYYANTGTGVLHLETELSEGNGVLRVVYTAGMATTTAAFIAAYPEIADWADKQVLYDLNRRISPGGTSTSMPQGGQSFTGQLKLLEGFVSVLRRYRAPRIG